MHLIKSCACGSNAPIGQVENYTLCPKQELAGDECGFVDEVVLFVGLQLLYGSLRERIHAFVPLDSRMGGNLLELHAEKERFTAEADYIARSMQEALHIIGIYE